MASSVSERSESWIAAAGDAKAPLLDGAEHSNGYHKILKKVKQFPFGSLLLAVVMITIGIQLKETGDVPKDFWMKSNPFGNLPVHPVLLIADVLLVLVSASAVLVSACKEFRLQRKATAGCIDPLCHALKSGRNLAFRLAHLISLCWYLPWINLAEALQAAALVWECQSCAALIDGLLFVVKTTRPQYWFFPLIPYWLGRTRRCFSVYEGTCHESDWETADGIDVFIIVGALSVFAYGINDWYDLPGDLLNARKLGAKHDDSELCVYSPEAMSKRYRLLRLSLICSVSAVLAWFALRASPMQILATGALMFLVWAYSAPPCRCKEIPYIDVVFNGTYSLCYFIGLREMVPGMTGIRIGLDVLKYVGACWLAQVLHELVDREADHNAGYRTMVVAYGSVGIAVFFLVMSALSVVLCWVVGWSTILQETMGVELIYVYAWLVNCVLWIIVAFLEKCRIPVLDFFVKHLKIIHFVYTFGRLRILHSYVNDILWLLM